MLGCSPADLPTLPDSALELQRLVNDDGTSVEALVRVISRDPALAARLLRIANSPVYATGTPVTTVERAILRVGFAEVGYLALGLTIMSAVGGKRPLRYRMQQRALWRHSLAVAAVTDHLAHEIFGWGKGYYIYGLLHDIGKIALDAHRPNQFIKVLETIEKKRVTWSQAENEVFMFDHSFVAQHLLVYWDLPPALVYAVGTHHTPWEASQIKEKAALVHLADMLARRMGYFSFDREKDLTDYSEPAPETKALFAELGWEPDTFLNDELRDKVEQTLEE
jgi:putative nucleotidyltransferase with HDIG domain